MPLGGYYTIKSTARLNDRDVFNIELNPLHELYKGHFPGNPILPGVCSIEIIKECASDILGKPASFADISTCKFTSLLTPIRTPVFNLDISLSNVKEGTEVMAKIYDTDNIFVTLKGILCQK